VAAEGGRCAGMSRSLTARLRLSGRWISRWRAEGAVRHARAAAGTAGSARSMAEADEGVEAEAGRCAHTGGQAQVTLDTPICLRSERKPYERGVRLDKQMLAQFCARSANSHEKGRGECRAARSAAQHRGARRKLPQPPLRRGARCARDMTRRLVLDQCEPVRISIEIQIIFRGSRARREDEPFPELLPLGNTSNGCALDDVLLPDLPKR